MRDLLRVGRETAAIIILKNFAAALALALAVACVGYVLERATHKLNAQANAQVRAADALEKIARVAENGCQQIPAASAPFKIILENAGGELSEVEREFVERGRREVEEMRRTQEAVLDTQRTKR